jgi:hypothetical protein
MYTYGYRVRLLLFLLSDSIGLLLVHVVAKFLDERTSNASEEPFRTGGVRVGRLYKPGLDDVQHFLHGWHGLKGSGIGHGLQVVKRWERRKRGVRGRCRGGDVGGTGGMESQRRTAKQRLDGLSTAPIYLAANLAVRYRDYIA